MESHEVLTLRAMVPGNAPKAKLHAMLATYWPSVSSVDAGDTSRTEMIERFRNFVAEVEENI